MAKKNFVIEYVNGVKHVKCLTFHAPRQGERTFPAKSCSVSNLGRKRVELNIKH